MNSIPDEKKTFQNCFQSQREQILMNIAKHEPFERFQLYLKWHFEELKWSEKDDY